MYCKVQRGGDGTAIKPSRVGLSRLSDEPVNVEHVLQGLLPTTNYDLVSCNIRPRRVSKRSILYNERLTKVNGSEGKRSTRLGTESSYRGHVRSEVMSRNVHELRSFGIQGEEIVVDDAKENGMRRKKQIITMK